ncbi:MAG: TetR/AcrR family transcriptional regulator [Anaerolineae bacterium]|nr:TetR/AcrR family transcriptional regulator [Anaerolineae bacterium]
MDLRVVKTKRNIREVFLELRSESTLEKIKVKKLCELALINKTTFYKHYQNIYALSEEIEDETIVSIMNSFEPINSLFVDPESFIKGLYYAFKSHEGLIMTLFSGRMNILLDKIESYLFTHYPSLSGIPEKEILLSFLLRGASHVLMEFKYDEAILLDTVSKITHQVIISVNVET